MRVICFDLDDTLYKEINYLKSAYREVASYATEHCRGCSDAPLILAAKAYDIMFKAYKDGKNAFENLNAFLGLSIPVNDYLQIYREHLPNIRLSDETVFVLDNLKSSGCIPGLISDGRSLQQRNKIEALNLGRWIDNDDIVISEEFGSEKPSFANYEYFMTRYPECKDFIYVGDNPEKDFVAPNSLGWKTVCLKDDGRNIHKQNMNGLAAAYLPKTIIESIEEITTENIM